MKVFFKAKNKRGVSLFVAVLVTSVALIMSLAISRIALKEVSLTQASRDSQVAFYASNSGVECGLFEDLRNQVFDPDQSEAPVLSCNGQVGQIDFPFGSIEQGEDPSCVSEGPSDPEAEHIPGECWEMTLSNFIYLNSLSLEGPCFDLRVVKQEFLKDYFDGLIEDEIYLTTALESRGYNTCDDVPRRVERAIRVNY